MTTIELPDDLAAALTAAAVARGTTEVELIAECVADAGPDALIGVGASGRREALDIDAERAGLAARHSADTI